MLPSEVMNNDYYIIVAMTQRKYNNEVIWQLKAHHHDQWGISFTNTFHSYRDYDLRLQKTVMDSINEILCKNKTMKEIIKPVYNCGPAGNLMGDIPELCWTTLWSHCLMEWFLKNMQILISLLLV